MGMNLPNRFEPLRFFRKDRLSSTFLATDQRLGRNEVVVKVFGRGKTSPDMAGAIDALAWYRGLRHSLIAPVLDAGISRTGDVYCVRSHHKPSDFFSSSPPTSVARLTAAVEFLHSKGRVHGSIKPGNVLSAGTEFHLADPWLGLSPAHETKALTEEDIRFTAPEVLDGGSPTLDSDLYSVGAMLYRVFSGRDPFEDSDLESLKAKYTWATPRPLNSVCYVSREVTDIVMHLLHREPGRRRRAFDALKAEFSVQDTVALQAPTLGLNTTLQETMDVVLRKGSLRVIAVEAPAGFGKSRFVSELASRIGLVSPSVAVCEVRSELSGFSLAHSIVRIIDEFKVSVPASCLERTRELLREESEPGRILDEKENDRDLVALIASVAQRIPFLLVIDDIDRANRRAWDVVQSVVEQRVELDFAILVTSRPGGMPRKTMTVLRSLGNNLHQLSLPTLNPKDSETLVSFFTNDRDRHVQAQKKGGGNPLFLEQYCQGRKATHTPKAVRTILSRMLQKLTGREKGVAEALAIFPDGAEWNVLLKVTGLQEAELREAMGQLERIGLATAQRPSVRYPDAQNLLEGGMPKSRKAKLHERAFESLRDAGINDELLAKHAFQAGLYETAAKLYLDLARIRSSAKDYGIAGTYYCQVLRCRRASEAVPPLDGTDTLRLALGYSFRGERTAALNTLNQLLDSESSRKDAELMSAGYAARGSVLLEESADERVRLLKLAIKSLPEGSAKLLDRRRSLVAALVCAGKLPEAEKTLNDLETVCCSAQDREQLDDLRSTILMNMGNFRDAAKCLMGRQFSLAPSGVVSNNLAVCLEHLGNLRESRELQRRALQEAESSGCVGLQIGALNNLGSMESKLGNLKSAETFFAMAFDKLRELERQHGESGLPNLAFLYSDPALFFLQKGDFNQAQLLIHQMNLWPNAHFPFETHSTLITRCQLELALGQRKEAAESFERVRQVNVSGAYIEIERLLTEASLSEPSSGLYERLSQSVEICQRLGTIFQECQVLLALTETCLALGKRLEANRSSRRARRLGVKCGFKVLEIRALLQIGLSSKRSVEKDFYLLKSLDESTRLGLAPLTAECAFSLGSWRLSQGAFIDGAEYLSRSVSITARLGENLTPTARRLYLQLPRHREARDLLVSALNRVRTRLAKFHEPVDKHDHLFVRLYRLTAAMTAAPTLASATAALLETLQDSMQHHILLAFGSGPDMSFHTLQGPVTEERKRHVMHVAAAAGGKTYITGSLTQRSRNPTVWVPVLSAGQNAGICAQSSRPQIGLEEREIEFLTVAAAVAGSAFDRISIKAGNIAPASADSYGIVGSSQQVKDLHVAIETAASNTATVLIEGESGTGKELVARAIHGASSRAKAPFVPVDCGALPGELIEAELFGAKKGAYTGALTDRSGLFEAADRGTIFLDEISNLSLVAQAKLLRVLQDREIRKIGSTTGRLVDVRVIAATNCSLEELVRDGKFRKDLLYRLNVLGVSLAPLRDRKDDIPLLATVFLERLNAANGTTKYFGPRVVDKLLRHDYPGNIRELQNAVERAFFSTRSGIITQLGFLESLTDRTSRDQTEQLFNDLIHGRQNFWLSVHDAYKRREIPREKVVALVDYGLRATRGNYKDMASRFQIPKEEYRRFMDFLRRNNCLLDFRPYRKIRGLLETEPIRQAGHS